MPSLPTSNKSTSYSVPPTPTTSFDRPNRLKSRDDGTIRWVDLLEKFKGTQDKAKRAKGIHLQVGEAPTPAPLGSMLEPASAKDKALPEAPTKQQQQASSRPLSAEGMAPRGSGPQHKSKSSLGNFSRLARGVGSQKNKK